MGDKRPVRHLQSTFQRREMKFVSLWHQNRANGKLQCFFPLSKTVSWQIQNRVKYFTLETGENNNGNVFLKTFCNLTTYLHPASVMDTVNKLVFHMYNLYVLCLFVPGVKGTNNTNECFLNHVAKTRSPRGWMWLQLKFRFFQRKYRCYKTQKQSNR